MINNKQHSVATGGHGWARAHPVPAVLGRGIRADRKYFWRGGGRGDGGRTRQQTCVKKHLTAANCLYISGFWGRCPQTPTGAADPGPRWGTSVLRPPVSTVNSEPGYATDNEKISCRLETARQLCISLQLGYFLSP